MVFNASPVLLDEPKHSRMFRSALTNVHAELRGAPQDDLGIDRGRSPPRLYILHIEQDSMELNHLHLRGWRYGDLILRFAERFYCRRWLAWRFLMRTRFDEASAEILYHPTLKEND